VDEYVDVTQKSNGSSKKEKFCTGKTRGERIFYSFNFTLISRFGYSLFLFWILSIYYLLNCFSNLFSEFEKEENKLGSKGFFYIWIYLRMKIGVIYEYC
jgi:hypothetical protein